MIARNILITATILLSACNTHQVSDISISEEVGKLRGLCLAEYCNENKRIFENFTNDYTAILNENEDIVFSKEADYKALFKDVAIRSGVYNLKPSKQNSIGKQHGITTTETLELDRYGNAVFNVSFDHDEGLYRKFEASGSYEVVGEVIQFKNLTGDSNILPSYKNLGARRCIITSISSEQIKLGCDARSYALGGDLLELNNEI